MRIVELVTLVVFAAALMAGYYVIFGPVAPPF